jgi:PAS domain S-box-containing protein
VAAGISTFVAGPLLPADAATNAPQPLSDWVSRGIFFVLIGQFVTALFGGVRQMSVREASLETEVGRELAAREQAEKRASAILEATLDAVITIDHTGRIIEFNPSAERKFMRAKADVLGVEMASVLIPPAGREAHRRGLKHLVETGQTAILDKRVEVTGLRGDGSGFPVELTITRASVEDELVFTAHVRDISERVRAEQALKLSMEEYRLMFDANPSPMWVFDVRRLTPARASSPSEKGTPSRWRFHPPSLLPWLEQQDVPFRDCVQHDSRVGGPPQLQTLEQVSVTAAHRESVVAEERALAHHGFVHTFE